MANKITDPDSLVVSTTEGNLGVNGNIWLDTVNKTFELAPYGDLAAKEGVTGNALWAKFVDLWCTAAYQPYPFPMNVLDARSGQYIFGQDPGGSFNGWVPKTDATRQMVRDAGWSEYLANGTLDRVYVGMVALASGYPGGAQFYYQITATGAAANFTFTDAPNEAIMVYENGGIDSRTFFKLYSREPSYLYADAVLGAVGETGTGPYKVSLPVSVGADLKITASDAFVSKSLAVTGATWVGGVATYTTATHGLTAGDYVSITGMTPEGYNVRGLVIECPLTTTFTVAITADPGTFSAGGTVKTIYDLINVKYFTGNFTRDIESVTGRNFGIVIDAGTHSGIDGSAPGGASVLTSAAGGLEVDFWIGGTLVIYEGTDKGTEFPITDNSATTITVTGTIATGSNMSFTLFPPGAKAVNATLPQIYTKIQYLLRQNSNINAVTGDVTGKTAALLLNFVGDRLDCGFYTPTNPNGGGTGVLVQGLRDADANSIVFYDNVPASRQYPYVSAGFLNFNPALVTGGAGYFRMYFTSTPDGDYGEAEAITVKKPNLTDIAGAISGAQISFTFDYTGNAQGSRTPNTPANVTVVAGNAGFAKPVVATGIITESKAISITLTAETDRAYLE
jgi:hypothetical protein